MIERFQLIQNIGQFDNVTPPHDLAFTPFTLIYAENGRGKTTLAAIFRSLASGTPEFIAERHRLGAEHPPKVVVIARGQSIEFENGAWSATLPDTAIFDDAFVAANVCSGIDLQPAHRQNLHELILGQQGVDLNRTLQGHVTRVEEHNLTLRALGEAIPAAARGPFSVDRFCALEADPEIDEKLTQAQRRVSAAEAQEAIRQRALFEAFSLPDFDDATINTVLASTIEMLDAAAAEHVREHITKLGQGSETWVSEGMPKIEPASEGADEELCPFCAQPLNQSTVIEHYRSYFSAEYEALKTRISEQGLGIKDTHSGDGVAAFERTIRTAIQNQEFWKDFAEIADIEIDTAAIVRDWNAAREAVLGRLRAKAAAPLEPMAILPEEQDHLRKYRTRITEVAALSARLVDVNGRLDLVKEQAAGDELATLKSDFAKLEAQKARFEMEVASCCDAYLVEKQAKKDTETLRNQTRDQLTEYRERIFPAYEQAINGYLQKLGAGFRLGEVQSVNTRGGSSASYCVVINSQNVPISAEEGPSFKNTLSAGDRNTLALAFFLASLEQDPNLNSKVVLIDDPMTSLDEHRRLRTREEIIELARRTQQVIVLSHEKTFLCSLWEQSDRNSRKSLRLNRAPVGSEFVLWDVREDSITEHDKRHKNVRDYLFRADPDQERKVAEALRPILEAFLRVAFPEHFPPGTLLCRFLNLADQRVGLPNEILSQADANELRRLTNYGNLFHHDTNPAWQTAAINDQQLNDFAKRTLLFSSRR